MLFYKPKLYITFKRFAMEGLRFRAVKSAFKSLDTLIFKVHNNND